MIWRPEASPAPDRRPPRVLLYSQRNAQLHMWEVPQTEFEDVIAEVDDADVLAPAFNWGGRLGQLRHAAGNRVRRALGQPKEWPIDAVEIEQDYDLFFATFHFAPNISVINRLRGLRKRCRRMACFLIECWSPRVEYKARYLRLLDVFDQVFVFNPASISAISRITRTPLSFLPTATDALRFSPWPLAEQRTVDVYGMGRSSPTVHAQLCEMAERDAIFYQHATVNHEVPDYRAHRVLVANLMRRTRYLFAYRINENRMALTGGEEALATRYFEGAAAGTVMLGSRTRSSEFDALFDWHDVVIPVSWNEDDIGAVLRRLDEQPERLARIRRDNVAGSLRRHDWVHRWGTVLDAVGLPRTGRMAEREARLASLADQVDSGWWMDVDSEAASTPAARRQPSQAAEARTGPRLIARA